MSTPIQQPTFFGTIAATATRTWDETLKPLILRVVAAVGSFFEGLKQFVCGLYEKMAPKPIAPPPAPTDDTVVVTAPTPRPEAKRGWFW